MENRRENIYLFDFAHAKVFSTEHLNEKKELVKKKKKDYKNLTQQY